MEEREYDDMLSAGQSAGRELQAKYAELQEEQTKLYDSYRKLARVEQSMLRLEERAQKLIDAGILEYRPFGWGPGPLYTTTRDGE